MFTPCDRYVIITYVDGREVITETCIHAFTHHQRYGPNEGEETAAAASAPSARRSSAGSVVAPLFLVIPVLGR